MSNKATRFKKSRFLLNSLKFNRYDFLNALFIAILASLYLYLEFFGFRFYLLNSIVAIYVFYRLLKASQPVLMLTAFFIGLLWFHWVGFSFSYVNMSWAIPFVALFFATGYALSFWIIGFSQKIYIRLPLIFLISFYNPLYFDWFRFELLLVNSYFGVTLWQYALLLITVGSFIYFEKKRYAPFIFIALLASVDYSTPQIKDLPLKVEVGQTMISQEKKWLGSELDTILDMNFRMIDEAIKEHKELVLLPESTFPLYLNQYPSLEAALKERSHYINIIVGSLYLEGQTPYNATYYFHKGEKQVAKKMVLVPFGEYIPLPKFIRKYINDIIFQGGADYETASAPTDFLVKGTKIRNAICYEATCELFYKDGVDYIVALTNNGWFLPSIEPTLQKLLIKLYAKRHGVTVMHSVNGSPSEIIRP